MIPLIHDIDIERNDLLEFAITNSKELTIFLVNGIKLEGKYYSNGRKLLSS